MANGADRWQFSRLYHKNADETPGQYRYYADMTASDFQQWLRDMGISGARAAEMLGVTANTITRYRRIGAPKVIGLACAALYHRLRGWGA